ncbi:MAG: hypothetical protein WDN24_10860 [Sphingomonas sp.]
MKRISAWTVGVALALAGAMPAQAQRMLDVPAGAGWKHAETGVILRSKLAGYPRTGIQDNSKSELDVMAMFSPPGDPTSLTVYIFHPALMSLPVWFDRSETQILLRDVFATPTPQGEVRAFAPPRGTIASGLRRVYVPGKGPYRSTGLATMPLGEWLVAVRISSTELDAAALDARMSEVIAAIGWPEGVAEGPAAAPVAPCARPLAYARRARMRKPSMTDALIGAALASAPDDKSAEALPVDAAPVVYCRDLPAPTSQYGVYRRPDDQKAYTMALGDAGMVIRVEPSLGALLGGGEPGYSVSLGTLEATMIYPNLDKLAGPAQVLDIVGKTSPISSSSRGGKDITISTGSQ